MRAVTLALTIGLIAASAPFTLPSLSISPATAENVHFTGTRHDGKAIDETALTGWRLYYFGYTFCPDVCPTSLVAVAEMLDAMGPMASRLTPVFVTVDPDRDTPSVMKDYVGAFHPAIVGLTPTDEGLKALAAAYRIKYQKVDLGPNRAYLMDHSASLFLIDPNGDVAGKFPHGMDARQMAAKVLTVFARADGKS